MFREGHQFEKNRRSCEKIHVIFHRFSWKIDQKSITKTRKNGFATKIDRKAFLGAPLFTKNRFWVIFGIPRGIQKCVQRGDLHWGKPLMGATWCQFGQLNDFFSILAPFCMHSRSPLDHFLANLVRFVIVFWCPLVFAFLALLCFFGICRWLGSLVLLVMLVLFVGGWVDWWCWLLLWFCWCWCFGAAVVGVAVGVDAGAGVSVGAVVAGAAVVSGISRQQSSNTAGQQHDGMVKQKHSNKARKHHSETATQQDSMNPINQQTNFPGKQHTNQLMRPGGMREAIKINN